MRVPSSAAVAFAVYLVASLTFGELHPLSEFAMYSRPMEHLTVAAPWFAAAGRRASADNFGCFVGVNPDLIQVPNHPHSARYVWHDWRRWATTRQSAGPDATIPVEFGYVLIRQSPHGVEVSAPVIQTSGLACPR